ncbi:MAG: hypothetical protein RSC97_11085 [Eubacterium sp.]
MEKLKIGIVGLGSIGIRHLKNISEILTEKQVAYSIDVIRSGKGKAIHSEIRSLIDGVLTEKDALKKQYDIFLSQIQRINIMQLLKHMQRPQHICL